MHNKSNTTSYITMCGVFGYIHALITVSSMWVRSWSVLLNVYEYKSMLKLSALRLIYAWFLRWLLRFCVCTVGANKNVWIFIVKNAFAVSFYKKF